MMLICCCSDNDANESDKKSPVSKVDVSYFRNLIQSESVRLAMLCAVWRSTMDDISDLSDEGNLLSSPSVCHVVIMVKLFTHVPHYQACISSCTDAVML